MHSRTASSTDAERRHFSGAWQIIWGDADAAVAELREAAWLGPSNASVQSDLAAALLERAELKQDPLSILHASVAADSALTLDPNLREARFNRAVVLEWLFLKKDAAAAWTSYLKLDGQSPWADEARARLEELRRTPPTWESARTRLQLATAALDQAGVDEIARVFPRRVRDTVRAEVTAWARAYLAQEPRSDTLLRRALIMARSIQKMTGDALSLDVVQPMLVAVARDERSRLDQTARGLIAEETGSQYLDPGRLNLDSAETWLREAHRSLRAAGSAAIYWVAYDSAQIPYQRHSATGYDAALAAFRRIRASAPASYKWVRGMSARSAGLIEAIRANFERAIADYYDAIKEGQGTGDPGLELRPRRDLASLLPGLRGERAAWEQLYSAFRASDRYADEPVEAQRLVITAAALSWKASPRTALLYQGEGVRLAGEGGDPLRMVPALTKQAELLARAGALALAVQRAREARGYASRIENASIKALYTADVDLVEGEVSLHTSANSAVRVLRGVVDRYRDTQYLREVDRANMLLARAYIASGAMDSAQRAFDETVAETERRRSGITDPEDRARFLDQARPIIDSIVRFRVDRADTLGALDFLESMRARVLLERVNRAPPNGAVTTARVTAVRRILPAATSVVSYALLDRELVTWLIRRDGVTMFRTPLAVSLSALVDRFSASIVERSSDSELQALSSQLHRVLVAPLVDRLEAGTRIVFVPDKVLHFVPFAALFDGQRGRFLVESFEISVAPSIHLYGESVARFAKLHDVPAPTVLAVGNPAFDPRIFMLPRLPGAEREAERVAADYDGSRLLIGPQATRRAFLQAARSADIIHFAGHGVIRPEAPLLSHLVLAPDPGGASSGELYARDLFGITLPRTRLAILSGCRTASGELSDTEGASSLARAFFAAGVPAVIASLWAVDDEQTAEFFGAYHRALARGADPGAALRNTQLQWLAHERDSWKSVKLWAAFELFGATSNGSAHESN